MNLVVKVNLYAFFSHFQFILLVEDAIIIPKKFFVSNQLGRKNQALQKEGLSKVFISLSIVY